MDREEELSVILCQQYWLVLGYCFETIHFLIRYRGKNKFAIAFFFFHTSELIPMLDYGRTILRDIEERPGVEALAADLRDPRNWIFK